MPILINTLYIFITMRGGKREKGREEGRKGKEIEERDRGKKYTGRSRYRLIMDFECLQKFDYQGKYWLP